MLNDMQGQAILGVFMHWIAAIGCLDSPGELLQPHPQFKLLIGLQLRFPPVFTGDSQFGELAPYCWPVPPAAPTPAAQ